MPGVSMVGARALRVRVSVLGNDCEERALVGTSPRCNCGLTIIQDTQIVDRRCPHGGHGREIGYSIDRELANHSVDPDRCECGVRPRVWARSIMRSREPVL